MIAYWKRLIEQQEKSTVLADACRKGSVEEQFYRALTESAQDHIQRGLHDLPPDSRAW
jgi:hypothetical protein